VTLRSRLARNSSTLLSSPVVRPLPAATFRGAFLAAFFVLFAALGFFAAFDCFCFFAVFLALVVFLEAFF
jgi:uncharacterized membrane protein YjdF